MAPTDPIGGGHCFLPSWKLYRDKKAILHKSVLPKSTQWISIVNYYPRQNTEKWVLQEATNLWNFVL